MAESFQEHLHRFLLEASRTDVQAGKSSERGSEAITEEACGTYLTTISWIRELTYIH